MPNAPTVKPLRVCANCNEIIQRYEPQRILENGKHTHVACPSERAHST